MKTSAAGLNIIKKHEGLRLNAYKDAVGVWTIGYGHTDGVYAGQVITNQQAQAYLVQDVKNSENAVITYVLNKGIPLTQNQFDALVSLVFNVGSGSIFTKKYTNGYTSGSTLYNMILKGNFSAAAERFMDFVKAGGVTLNGLVKRRKDEMLLFLDGKKKVCSECLRLLE